MSWGGLGIFVLGIIIFICGVGPYSFTRTDHTVIVGSSLSTTPALPQNRQGERPSCMQWHTVTQGENQWVIARQYAPHTNRSRWIKSMRWVSRKSVGDEDLKAGESVCVRWSNVI